MSISHFFTTKKKSLLSTNYVDKCTDYGKLYKSCKNTIQDTKGEIMEKIYLTATTLAARWHITSHTLAQWRWNGNGPRFSKMGKRILYELKHVEAFEEGAVHQNTSYIL
jgi:hypothetical protein